VLSDGFICHPPGATELVIVCRKSCIWQGRDAIAKWVLRD
jgi:hypothetical protein